MGFDVVGTIKNLPEGTVELDIMGEEEEELEEFLQEIVEESTMAHYIKEVHTHEIPELKNVKGFIISA